MVKSTRNGKLPPSAGGKEFTGFAAFASHTSPAAAAAIQHLSSHKSQRVQQQQEKDVAPAQKNKLGPSPIYTGTDGTLLQIFKRISKKDSTTKSRALAELANYAFPCSASDEQPLEAKLIKSEQIRVFCHFYFLFVNKLVHDNNAAVRNEAIRVFGNAAVHVPKACNGLLRQNTCARSEQGDTTVGSIGNAIGWIYFFQSSQVVEEVKTAKRSWNLLLETLEKFQDEEEQEGGQGSNLNAFIVPSILCHGESILHASARAVTLENAFSVTSKSLQMKQQGEQRRKGGKQQSDASKDNSSTSNLDENEKEAMEERYERVVLLTLRAMESFFREYNETTLGSCSYFDAMMDPSALWKHLNSQKSSFRRGTFGLVSCVAQNAPSLLHKEKGGQEVSQVKQSNLSKLLMNTLSSERDPANFTAMFEMLLLYIISFQKYHGRVAAAWEVSDSSSSVFHCPGMDAATFVKTLSKVLRRACYGSSSLEWTPTMLPIVATLQSIEHQLHILSSLVSFILIDVSVGLSLFRAL
jgi:Uncharacterized conserved protein, contains RING Zn-finger